MRGGSFSLVGLETGASNSVTKERVFSKPEALEVMRKWRNLDGREVLMSYAYSAAQRALSRSGSATTRRHAREGYAQWEDGPQKARFWCLGGKIW